MLVYLCDLCGSLIPEEQAYFRRKEILCKQCRGDTSATLVKEAPLPRSKLCEEDDVGMPKEKSAVFGQNNSAARDMRFLLGIFFICVFIPLLTGVTAYFLTLRKPHPSDATPDKDSVLSLQQEMTKLREEIRESRARPGQADGTQSEKGRDTLEVSDRERESALNYLYLEKLTSSISNAALQSIAEKLRQGTADEKLEAILEIAALRERDAIPLLEEVLCDNDPLVRSLSARVLGILGAHQSVGRLMFALGDPEIIVRQSAAEALSQLTGETFIYYEDLPPEKWEQLQQLRDRQTKKK